MPLTLDLAQTVAIGAFNPYLISPDWLVKYGICPEGNVELRLAALGGAASFRFGTVSWDVNNQRLIVSSSKASDDCGQIVSQVLRLLPHTPVRAVGHNFHFSASRHDWGDRPVPVLGGKRLEDFDQAEQARWVGVFHHPPEVRIEVALACVREAVAVLFNHHRNLDLEQARKAQGPEEQIRPATMAAEKFRVDFDASLRLLQSLFEVEMDNA